MFSPSIFPREIIGLNIHTNLAKNSLLGSLRITQGCGGQDFQLRSSVPPPPQPPNMLPCPCEVSRFFFWGPWENHKAIALSLFLFTFDILLPSPCPCFTSLAILCHFFPPAGGLSCSVSGPCLLLTFAGPASPESAQDPYLAAPASCLSLAHSWSDS